jgi:hypothetical protein
VDKKLELVPIPVADVDRASRVEPGRAGHTARAAHTP